MADDQSLYALNEKIVNAPIEDEMKNSYIDYAMSVIVGRALPDARDGLKPVHRRILYAMSDLGLTWNKPYKKSARVVGECFVEGTWVLTSQGLVPIEEVRRDDEVYTESGIRKVTELYEMPPQGLIEVSLEGGTSSTATQGQLFRTLNRTLDFDWKRADELTPDDYVVVKARYPNINQSVGLKLNAGSHEKVVLDEALAYVLGFWISDGWIEKATRRLGFYSNTREVIERIQAILKEKFSYDLRIEEKHYHVETSKGRKKGVGYQIRISQGWLTRFFIDSFGWARMSAPTKAIPREIFCSPSPVVFAFVSGLLDGDGSVHVSRNAIHYGSVSLHLIRGLSLLMQQHGIFAHVCEEAPQNGGVIDGRVVKARHRFYALEWRGSNAHKLAKLANPLDPRKKSRLVEMAGRRLKKSMHEVIPRAAAAVFGELRAKHLGSGWYMGAEGEKFRQGICYSTGAKVRYSRDLLETPLRRSQIAEWGIQRKLERMGSPLASTLSHIEGQDLYFLKVVSVKCAPAQKTYDLQVEGDHNFIANGMVVHNCLGKYHPHGDMAVYDSLVRMVQDFSLRYPLIDGQGNFGSVDGDNSAAMRYTECRMARITEEILADIEKETVAFVPNFDESLLEPALLPTKIPVLLANGSSGIAVGMATNIPPHNLSEVVEGLTALIDSPEIAVKDLMKIVKGPDFPTGGLICGRDGIREAFSTGRGHLKVRAKAGIEEQKGGREAIIVTEIPYMVNKANLIESIARLVEAKKIEGISDVRDESDRDGMRVVIELKRDVPSQVVLNNLYKHTQMQETFGVIMLALVAGEPRVLSLKELMEQFIIFREEVVVRRTRFELDQAEKRAHILEGLKIALADLDRVIKTIRQSKSPEAAKEALVKNFKLSEIQAKAILEMQLQRLTALEREKIEAEYLELIKKIEFYKSVLKSRRKVLDIIKGELAEVKKTYGDERRTQIVADETDIEIEDLIPVEDVLITISHAGYIKRIPVAAYRKQRRGGTGVTGSAVREEDFIEHLFLCSTHDSILFFSSKGRVYWRRAYEIPQASRQAKGKAIVNLLALSAGEGITSFVQVKEFDDKHALIMATRKGQIKKTNLAAFSHPRMTGIQAIHLRSGDELIACEVTDGHQEILLATRQGKAIRFPEKQVREMGRTAGGVRGVSLSAKDVVVGMEIVDKKAFLLSITHKGFGKKTLFNQYRLQSRGGKGIINVKVTPKNGPVEAVLTVRGGDELIVVTTNGMVVRTQVDEIRTSGRNAQGVRVIRLRERDTVANAARVVAREEEGAGEPQEA